MINAKCRLLDELQSLHNTVFDCKFCCFPFVPLHLPSVLFAGSPLGCNQRLKSPYGANSKINVGRLPLGILTDGVLFSVEVNVTIVLVCVKQTNPIE